MGRQNGQAEEVIMSQEISIDSLLEEIQKSASETTEYEPVAFFDADHTLWAGDLGDVVARTAMNQGLLKPEAKDILAQILNRSGGESTGEPNADALALMKQYFEDKVTENDIISAQVVCYAGWTTKELFDFALEIFDREFEPKIYEDIPKLHEALRTAGFKIKVISGSPHWVVEAAATRLGIEKADVAGARAYVKDEIITAEMQLPITYKDGKVEVMSNWIGDKQAFIAFGDSKSDYPMQERSKIRVAVNPRPGVRRYAAENEPDSWRLWVPQKTRDGIAVERIDSDRVITE